MGNMFSTFFDCVKAKKGYFVFLLLVTLVVSGFGVFAAINFSSQVLSVDLTNISYIMFLKNQCSLVSMIFRLLFSVAIFFAVVLCCFSKPWLVPLGVLFYLYFVYSQVAVFVSIVLVYGFLNCIILMLFLIVYILALLFIFLLFMCELFCIADNDRYFSCCVD